MAILVILHKLKKECNFILYTFESPSGNNTQSASVSDDTSSAPIPDDTSSV
jgi:hypothetical protein